MRMVHGRVDTMVGTNLELGYRNDRLVCSALAVVESV